MPDFRNVLNSFIWQDYDLAPDYPRLFGFIEFWQAQIEGPLHSVRFTHRKLISPGEWRNVQGNSICTDAAFARDRRGAPPGCVTPRVPPGRAGSSRTGRADHPDRRSCRGPGTTPRPAAANGHSAGR
ncbi:usg protein [Gemmobacter lanyuensis]